MVEETCHMTHVKLASAGANRRKLNHAGAVSERDHGALSNTLEAVLASILYKVPVGQKCLPLFALCPLLRVLVLY